MKTQWSLYIKLNFCLTYLLPMANFGTHNRFGETTTAFNPPKSSGSQIKNSSCHSYILVKKTRKEQKYSRYQIKSESNYRESIKLTHWVVWSWWGKVKNFKFLAKIPDWTESAEQSDGIVVIDRIQETWCLIGSKRTNGRSVCCCEGEIKSFLCQQSPCQ